MKRPLRCFPWLILSAFVVNSLLGANKVVVNAVATPEYLTARAADQSMQIQTYQFMKGQYFSGDVKRVTMEEFSFMELLESLAVQLQRQGFYPHKENGKGDLVIVVHYGVTDHPKSFSEDLGYTSLADIGFQDTADVEDIEFALHAQEWMQSSRASSTRNKAMLLGMEEAFDWKREFSDRALQGMVEQARYFVVLIAFDLPLAKQGIIQAHWMTRYSIRATGQSYDKAVLAMNEVAGNYFGKDLDELQREFPDYDSRVEIGEIEVIKQEEE